MAAVKEQHEMCILDETGDTKLILRKRTMNGELLKRIVHSYLNRNEKDLLNAVRQLSIG